MPQFAPSSRLNTRALRQSWCNAGFHYGLVATQAALSRCRVRRTLNLTGSGMPFQRSPGRVHTDTRR